MIVRVTTRLDIDIYGLAKRNGIPVSRKDVLSWLREDIRVMFDQLAEDSVYSGSLKVGRRTVTEVSSGRKDDAEEEAA